jgi:hypothetical protein
MPRVSSLPVNPMSVDVNAPMISADFFINFSFGVQRPHHATSLTAHVRRAGQRAGHRILFREEAAGRGRFVIDLGATRA